MKTKLPRWLLTLGFALMLGAPALALTLPAGREPATTEKRTRAAMPPLTLANIAEFPGQFEAFVRDNFGFRDELIKWHSLTQVRWFGRSNVPNVVVGRDGWLFYAGYNDGQDIAEFQGKRPITGEQLALRQRQLEERQTALAAHGIPYVFVVVPNKHSVYGRYLPLRIGERKPGNHLDSFTTHMGAHSPLTLVDTRTVLSAHHNERPLYFHTDSHWNADGAFLSYQQVMQAAQRLRPGLTVLSESDFEVSRVPCAGGDLANMLALSKQLQDVSVTYTVRPTAPPPLPLTVVVIGDSFMAGLEPFLRATFANVRTHRVYDGGFVLERILAEKPALVIDERVERYLLLW